GGAEFHSPGRFKTLAPQCVDPHACGLKNMYFRGDDDFYRDLGQALDAARAREIRFIGNRQQIARALLQVKHRHPRLRGAYERLDFFRFDRVAKIVALSVLDRRDQRLRLTDDFEDTTRHMAVLALVAAADVVGLAEVTAVDEEVDRGAVIADEQPVPYILAVA